MKGAFSLVAMVGVMGGYLWLTGCETTAAGGKHEMAAQKADYPIGCQKCYDEAVRVRQSGKRYPKSQVIHKHMCPDCKTEVTTYTEDGQTMIKCARCVPEGIACDRCLPPKDKS